MLIFVTRAPIQYKDAVLPVKEIYCGDKTVVRSSYLHNEISYTGKMSFLYWIRIQACIYVSMTGSENTKNSTTQCEISRQSIFHLKVPIMVHPFLCCDDFAKRIVCRYVLVLIFSCILVLNAHSAYGLLCNIWKYGQLELNSLDSRTLASLICVRTIAWVLLC